MMKLVVAAAFLVLQFYVYRYFATEEVYPERIDFASFPLQIGEWRCPRQDEMTPDILENLGATDYLICDYARAGTPIRVGVYVGFHESQVRKEGGGAGGGQIHPPSHCLPGSGWDIIARSKTWLELPGLPGGGGFVNRLVIAKGDARQLVYYWYQERGRIIADDWMKIVWLFWDRARTRRTDGSLVRFTIPMSRDDEAAADEQFRAFAPLVTAELPPYSPS